MLYLPAILIVAGVLALALGLGVGAPPPARRPAPEGRPDPGAETIVFVVLDNVRADRLSLCGHDRPTSPRLQALVRGGAAHTCRAFAPGSWTLPSHASFFTGVDVPTHGAHSLPQGGEALGRSTSESVRALDGALPTLAEQLAGRGYQTLLVSGNPVLSPESGLTRGFDRVRVAEKFNTLHGRALGRAVKEVLADADPNRPLFLFVNIADAHQPWRRVPARVSWLPRRASFRLHASKPGGFWQSWYRGGLDTTEKVETLGHLQDVYDYGIHRADRTLGRVLTRVRQSGWDAPGLRTVVTADHGEFLGEHGLLDHGHYLEDENQRVLLLVDGEGVEALPEGPVSATQAFHLARDGALAPDGVPVEATTYPHRQREVWSGGAAYGQSSVARWSDTGRELWTDGQAAPPALSGLVERAQRSGSRGGGASAEVLEMLRAAGYVE